MEVILAIGGGLSSGLIAWALVSNVGVNEKIKSEDMLELIAKSAGRKVGPLAKLLFPDLCQQTQKQMSQLGTSALNVSAVNFLGAALAIGLAFFLFMFILCWLAGMALSTTVLLSLVFGTVMGLTIYRQIPQRLELRQKSLDKEFPFFLEFIVMTKEAGATLPNAINAFVEAAPNSLIAKEITEIIHKKALGPNGLLGAMEDYRSDCPSSMGQTAVAAIVEADKLGAESGTTLRSLADDMRASRTEQAASAAEKLKSSIALPMTVMMVGALIVVLAGSIPKLFFGF